MKSFDSPSVGLVEADRLDVYTGAQLSQIYAEITKAPPVKFRDLDQGRKRVAAVMGTIPDPVPEPAAVPPVPAPADPGPRALRKKVRKRFNREPKGFVRPHREGTQKAALIEALRKGATFEECERVTGWSNYKQLYEAIHVVNVTYGYGLREGEDGVIYLVVPQEGTAPPFRVEGGA